MDDLEPTLPSPPNEDLAEVSPVDASGAKDAVRVSGYRVIRQLGEGGMGQVWEAEQSEPIRRRIALKVIKWGMDTKEILGRFESERQALALMDHPCIAEVYEAGATERGRPYFAMELVRGVPITDYCDRHRLSTRQRLELFVRVCEGVQHAHQKGIIHRDIKPSNVLVKLQDGDPMPKIIDFGLAKATAQRLTEHTVLTEYGQPIGTPAYMSPEQAEMTVLDIDTRTDIYSLGVLLYELLVGALPFDVKELHEGGFEETRRRIREDEPPRPSTRVSGLVDGSTTRARNRSSDVPGLVKRLRGDLDWIVMKALDKDRTRRYETANALAMDIRRHLSHEPVLASPPSARYRLRKFVRRHRTGMAFAVVVALALLAGGVGTTAGLVRAKRAEAVAVHEADRASREADAAQLVSDFLVELFEVSDPWESEGNEITARELLDKGAERIREELTDEPEVRARLMHTIGDVYGGLGLYSQSESLLREALAIRNEGLGREHPDTLTSMSRLASILNSQGRYEEAESIYSDTLDLNRRLLGEEHPDTLASKDNLARVLKNRGMIERAELLHREALGAKRRVLGEMHPSTVVSMKALGILYHESGRYSAAEPLILEVLGNERKRLGDDHPNTLQAMNTLANVYTSQGRYEEAKSLYLRATEGLRRVLGESHQDTLLTMNNLAVHYQQRGLYDESRELLERIISTTEQARGTSDRSYPIFVHSLGELLLATGDLHQAKQELGRAVEIYESGGGHQYLGLALFQLASISAREREGETALALLSRAIEEGYQDEAIAEDAEFVSLLGDPRFEALAEQAREKATKADN